MFGCIWLTVIHQFCSKCMYSNELFNSRLQLYTVCFVYCWRFFLNLMFSVCNEYANFSDIVNMFAFWLISFFFSTCTALTCLTNFIYRYKFINFRSPQPNQHTTDTHEYKKNPLQIKTQKKY